MNITKQPTSKQWKNDKTKDAKNNKITIISKKHNELTNNEKQ